MLCYMHTIHGYTSAKTVKLFPRFLLAFNNQYNREAQNSKSLKNLDKAPHLSDLDVILCLAIHLHTIPVV